MTRLPPAAATATNPVKARPHRRRSRYRLADLLKSCKGPPHPEAWSVPIGNEII